MKKVLSFALTLALGVCLGAGGLSLIARSDAAGTGKTAEPTNDPIYINGQKMNVEVYKIDGSNYFKLRDLGKALDFYVGWSQERGVYIEGDRSYEEPAPSAPDPSAELFAQLNGKSFEFASGAGGWSTGLGFGPNGTFKGNYHDSDMGDTGNGYPYGTVYVCDFSGSFSNAVKVDNFTWTIRLKDVKLSRTPGETEIEDGIRYIYSEPYGLDDGDLFYIYLPGRPTADLPEQYIWWIRMPHAWGDNDVPSTLPFWGLYNVGGEMGFFS